MIINITEEDIRVAARLPLKFPTKTINEHMREAEITLKINLGTNYEDDKEILRLLKILYTLMTLVPEANIYYSQGLNKAREKGSDFQLLSESQITIKIERYETRAKVLLDSIVIYPLDPDPEEESDPTDLIDDAFRMGVNDGDWSQTDLTE